MGTSGHAFRPTAEAASRNRDPSPAMRRPWLGASGAPCFVRRRGGFFRALVRVKDSEFRLRRNPMLCFCSTRMLCFAFALLECYALLASALLTRDPAEPVTASGPWRDRVRRPRLGASGAPCFVRRRGGFFRGNLRVKDSEIWLRRIPMLACLLFAYLLEFYACLLACFLLTY